MAFGERVLKLDHVCRRMRPMFTAADGMSQHPPCLNYFRILQHRLLTGSHII
ncbi:uncharacterized protein CLUP02_06477 [Colletotrichum lupini]|uniref:Uncharacterized protein n=1 Tax=Colletotrichum lupini TaxID=145971 RepID=A0A9Q8WF55_9PEZI|nr:uncharacterized protein CLUP02_06477 [Colletotrichum lupini]UQC80991.1 hypothetical protein CLUP02_06477 [Colletotrichum lupini]